MTDNQDSGSAADGAGKSSIPLTRRAEVERITREIMEKVRVIDIHTHIYSAAFGQLLLWGIDEL